MKAIGNLLLVVTALALIGVGVGVCTREPTAADAAQRCAEHGFRLRFDDLPECARRQQLADRQRTAGETVPPGCMMAPIWLVCF